MESLPQLIAPSQELDHILAQVEEAARYFSSPDPVIRKRGEDIFLQVRQSTEAIDFACYALSRARDAFVLFQAFQAILDNLCSLLLNYCTPSVPSLTVLRDFVLAIILARSTIEVKSTLAKSSRDAKSSSSSAQSWSDKTAWPNYLSKRAFQVFSAVEKRICGLELEQAKQSAGSIQDAIQKHTDYILTKLTSLTSLPDTTLNTEEGYLLLRCNIVNGVGLLAAILEEFSITGHNRGSKSEGRGANLDHTGLLPLQHRWCKAVIQIYILPTLFGITLQNLCLTLPGQKHAEHKYFFYLMVSITAKICSWTFLIESPFAGLEEAINVDQQTRLLKGDEATEVDNENINVDGDARQSSQQSFRPLPLSHAHFISKDVITALYLAYIYATESDRGARRDGDATSRILDLRSSMLNIASLRLVNEDVEAQEAIRESKKCQLECIQGIVSAECSDPQQNHDGTFANSLFFISQLFHCFLSSSNETKQLFALVDVGILLQILSQLTALVLEFAFEIREDSDEEDDLIELGDDAIDNVLACWRILLSHSIEPEVDASLTQYIRDQVFSNVVQPYVELRLQNAGERALQGEESSSNFGQESIPDVEKYDQQLVTMASLARNADLTSCISFLSDICNGHFIDDLFEFYSTNKIIHMDEKRLECLWEQTHWFSLMVGHILADQSKGEVAGIPQEIAILSVNSQQLILQLIQRLSFNNLDLFSQPRDKVQSPRVTETILWLTARWIPIYLLSQTTPFFSENFCNQGGVNILRILLHHLQGSIRLWSADADVVLQIASLIKSFSLSEGVMQVLLGMTEFGETIKMITEGLEALPAKTHGPLISSIVGCIYSSAASQSPELYFAYIKDAIEKRLNEIIEQPNFTSSQISQRSDVISSLLNALDMLDGLASSIQPNSAMAVYQFFNNFFEKLSGLIKLYQERSEVVLGIVRVYRTLIGALDLGFGANPQVITSLNVAVSNLLTCIDSRSLLGDSPEMALEESIPFEGLGLMIDLLTDLMLASENDAVDIHRWTRPISKEVTSDVCLQGFATIIPLLNGDARSVPSIQIKFVNLTSKLWLSFPHRIAGLAIGAIDEQSVQLFEACTTALVICLGFVESDLVIDCFGAIQELSTASDKVLNMSVNGVSTNVLQVLHHSFTAILTTLLRGVLIDALATSLFDLHLLAVRALTMILTRDNLGGWSLLQAEMGSFCSTTKLTPDRAIEAHLRPEEEMKKRTVLSQVIGQLLTLSFHQNNVNLDRQTRKDQREVYLQDARKIAWEGRAKIRAEL